MKNLSGEKQQNKTKTSKEYLPTQLPPQMLVSPSVPTLK